MKIHGTNMINKTNPYNKHSNKQYSVSDTSKNKDKLSISAEAMAMLDEVSGKQQLERQEKIAELKQQVQSGTYRVEAGKVAEKLLDWWK